jgi:peptidoglycan hydrolase-like protein with peptidoglycan-binding domain
VLKSIFSALALFAWACSSIAATPAKPHKRRHPAATPAATHARKPAAAGAKTTPVKGGKATARRKGKGARGPSRLSQQAPTPDRYREIQRALAAKGYFRGEPNGAWGPDSADALKRFQAEQNLMPDGKINSLSLIALGLGPKRLTAKSEPALPAATSPGPSAAPAAPGPPQ